MGGKPKDDILLQGARRKKQNSTQLVIPTPKPTPPEEPKVPKTEEKPVQSPPKPSQGLDDAMIFDILKKGSYVDEQSLTQAYTTAQQNKRHIREQLLANGLITKDLLGQAIAEHFEVPYVDLNTHIPTKEEVEKIPEELARKYNVVWFSEEDALVAITSANPKQPGIEQALAPLFPQKKVQIAFSLPEDISAAFIHYRKRLQERFAEIIKSQQRIAPEIVEEILEDGIIQNASDIHFEPQAEDVSLRFRIDGVLREVGRIQKQHYESILNRIKVQSRLRIDEHDVTQDGAIRFQKNEFSSDVRVSIAPTMEGEKVVMRLLGQYVQNFSLAEIGLSSTNLAMLEEASKKPFGMILVTGPTGSGKSTTLYSVLKSVNKPDINITTIEDPVEYRLAGMNQIQVNEAKKITFARGLRSIVRQDPDVILVGEIRDNETAEIAINAALTGHLLFSTFHANDAATTIPRLLDMDIEPFLMASTLELVIAQRLVRKVHETCRTSVTITRAEIEKLNPKAAPFFGENTRQYRGKGCDVCGHSGYLGRTAIFEFIAVTPEMKDLILKHPSAKEIWKLARTQGARSLFEDGVDQVKNGVTTVEELLRVAAPPDGVIEKSAPVSTEEKNTKSSIEQPVPKQPKEVAEKKEDTKK